MHRLPWAFLIVLACTPPTAGDVLTPQPSAADSLLLRAAQARDAWARVGGYYAARIAPLERALASRTEDAAVAKAAAIAVAREAVRTRLDPWLLLGVMFVENPDLDPRAVSSVGAVGLMQVMPFHAGSWPPCSGPLVEVSANVCHGAQILAHYVDASGGDLRRALLRYNGCVRGTNTPDCHEYPYWAMLRVFTARRAATAGEAAL